MAPPSNTKPTIPPTASAEPVVLVPTNLQLGDCMVPAFDEAGDLLAEPIRCIRITVDTVVGTFHVAVNYETAEALCRGLAQGLKLTVAERLHVAGSIPPAGGPVGNGRRG